MRPNADNYYIKFVEAEEESSAPKKMSKTQTPIIALQY